MKIITIFGTRPEAIKMCPLILKLKQTQKIKCTVCLTGQHREMMNPIMDFFGVHPDYNLDIMKTNQTLSYITADILNKLNPILDAEEPDMVLVHGDTTTSFSAALAGFYKEIPIGHVEAGLRTYNIKAPYPEEFNRQAVDLISSFYFAPTEWAKQNLLKENKYRKNIYVTGNTVIDALAYTVRSDYKNPNLKWANDSRLILFTAHRRESLGQPMRNMLRALKRIVEEFSDIKVIYPIHKNPKVRNIVQEELGHIKRIRIIEPLDVIDFHNFMAHSTLILTDSGGIQEEAPSLGKPVLVMRETTERPEGLDAGILKLVGTTEETIYTETHKLLTNPSEYKNMSYSRNPYGDGHASERIVNAILENFKERR